jgi:uncharacterized protein
MHCARCGMCCQETEMLLSEGDIKRIERLGYGTKRFVRIDKAGYAKLRNTQKHCVFYDPLKKECSIYDRRPEGCHVYPVVFDYSAGIVVDEICGERNTMTYQEQAETGLQVKSLLTRIDKEAQKRVKKKSRKD